MATQALPGPAAAPRLRVGRSAGYALVGFPLAIATFVLLVAGFAVGIGTLAITIGIVVGGGPQGHRARPRGRGGRPAQRRE